MLLHLWPTVADRGHFKVMDQVTGVWIPRAQQSLIHRRGSTVFSERMNTVSRKIRGMLCRREAGRREWFETWEAERIFKRCQGQRKNLDEAALHNKSLVKAQMKLQCRINSTCVREKWGEEESKAWAPEYAGSLGFGSRKTRCRWNEMKRARCQKERKKE